MSQRSLKTDEDLRAACGALGRATRADPTGYASWPERSSSSDLRTRPNVPTEPSRSACGRTTTSRRSGRGINLDAALDDEGFRRWLASRSMQPLPETTDGRIEFLTSLYEDIKAQLQPFGLRAVPHLKIFRVIAVLYPHGMTTIASAGMLDELTRAMGAPRRLPLRLPLAERHVWVRDRLDRVLGLPSAASSQVPCRLLRRFGKARHAKSCSMCCGRVRPRPRRVPLGVAINVLQNELAVVKSQGGLYVLTKRGEDVLESQDPSHLAIGC
jgi:hypothetical protein